MQTRHAGLLSSCLAISMPSSIVLSAALSPMDSSFSSMAFMSTWTGKSSPHSAWMRSTISRTNCVRLSYVWAPYLSVRVLRAGLMNHWGMLLPAQLSSKASKPHFCSCLTPST